MTTTPHKNRERDEAVGRVLALWMKEHGLSDGKFAKLVGSSAPTVQTWRKGTRPYPHWHAKLLKVTDLDFSDPDSIAAAAPPPDSTPTPDRVLAYGSIEGLEFACRVLDEVLATGRPIDPSNANDGLALRLMSEALTLETERREREDVRYKTAAGLRELVSSHPDPMTAIRFLRENAGVDPEVLDAVERNVTPVMTVSA